MLTCSAFRKAHLSLHAFGLDEVRDFPSYFCTPADASILYAPGVDGIHYCTVPDFGSMVFVVLPMESPGNYVHPVAENFEDFLRLLLAVGEEAAIGQAYFMDDAQWDDFLRKNPCTEEQKTLIRTIEERCALTPMEQPLAYIHAVQKAFDPSRIRFSEEYAEWVGDDAPPAFIPPKSWKVYFYGSRMGREHAAVPLELPLPQPQTWNDRTWQVLGVYRASAGLVVDFLAETNSGHFPETLPDTILPRLDVNGIPFRNSDGHLLFWENQAADQPEVRWILGHYGHTPAESGYVFRYAFPWPTRRKPTIRTLTFRLEHVPGYAPAGTWRTQTGENGDPVTVCHPVTGTPCTLTAQSQITERLEAALSPGGTPLWYAELTYAVTPSLPADALHLEEISDGETGEEISSGEEVPCASFTACFGDTFPVHTAPSFPADVEGEEAAAMGIIGGADGPTALLFAPTEPTSRTDDTHAALSSLHQTPVTSVTWNILFREEKQTDACFPLL